MPQKQPDAAILSTVPYLADDLDTVLQKIQECIAAKRNPEHSFALIHLVTGVSLEDWLALAAQSRTQDWLALPLSEKDRGPLEALHLVMENLTYQRDHDFLTGLANRRLFSRLASQELQRARRTETPLSLVMVDIDSFKDVNDTYGHAVGDTVLASLGKLLKRSMRVYDIAARLGGEEFCLLLPGATGLQAYDLTMRILEEFRVIEFEAASGDRFTKSFSAGIATCSGKGQDSIDTLLHKADELLYTAKKQGKNRICIQTPSCAISDNPALVQASEKQFLFTGKKPS
jgi:diguanylate cyclase (GGDEF) domain